MAKRSAPRRGSLAYSPRKRARRIYPRVRTWPKLEEPKLMGFAGYKAGMTHFFVTDPRKESPTAGKEVFTPVTVLECPPLVPFAIRAYKKTPYGLKASGEILIEKPNKILNTKTSLPKQTPSQKDIIGDFVTVLLHTQPRSAVNKKKTEIFESKIGGATFEDQLKYAKDILGKQIRVVDVFKPGEYIDVIAVTKGKGMQGPVKRFHVTIQPRKQRRGGKGRHIGTLGGRGTSTRWTAPQAGQTGYGTRTEHNKVLLKIGNNGEEITPKGGFVGYGMINGDYIVLKGSVPGPAKRLIRFRPAVRPHAETAEPSISYINLTSKQSR